MSQDPHDGARAHEQQPPVVPPLPQTPAHAAAAAPASTAQTPGGAPVPPDATPQPHAAPPAGDPAWQAAQAPHAAPPAGDPAWQVPPAPHAAPQPPAPGHPGPASYPGAGYARAGQQPAAPGPASALFTSRSLLGALATAGIAIAGVFVAGVPLLGAVVLAAGAASDMLAPTGLDPAGALLQMYFVLLGLILGGELRVRADIDALFVSVAGDGAVWTFPLLLTAGVMLLVAWWASRAERRAPLSAWWLRLVHSLAVGLVATLVVFVFTLLFSVREEGEGATIVISSAGIRLVLCGTLLLTLAAWAGREAGHRARAGESVFRAAARALSAAPRVAREVATYVTAMAVVFVPLALIFAIVGMVQADAAMAIPMAIVWVLNIAPVLVVLAHLGGVEAGADAMGMGQHELLSAFSAGDATLGIWLCVLAALLTTVYVSVRIGAMRPRYEGWDVKRMWQLPVAVLALWTLFALLLFGISAGGNAEGGFDMSGSMHVWLSMSWWSVPVLLVWAIVVEVLAHVLPAVAFGMSPALLAFLAGRRNAQAWFHSGVAPQPQPVFAQQPQPGAAPQAAFPQQPQQGTAPQAAFPQAPGAAPEQPTPFAGAPGPWAPQPGHPMQPGVASPPKPLSPAAKRGLLWGGIGAGALVLIIGGGAIAINVVNGSRGPEGQVEAYLNLIAEGKGDEAADLVPIGESTGTPLLSDAALAGATERISDVQVGGVRGSGDERTVEVTYHLAGEEHTGEVAVRRGANEMLFLETWEIAAPFVTDVDLIGETVGSEASVTGLIGDAEFEFSGDATLTLFPGVYELTSPEGGLFELALDEPMVVTGPSGLALSLEMHMVDLAPTEALLDELQTQVNAYVDECAASTDSWLDCGPYAIGASGDVQWEVVEYPAIEEVQGTSFTFSGGTLSATYDHWSGERRTGEGEVYGYGDFTIDGDEVIAEF